MYRKYKTKQYTVKLCKPAIGTQVYNEYEDVTETTTYENPFVIIGTVGEKSVPSVATLLKKYDIDEKTLKTVGDEPISITTRKNENCVWASHILLREGKFEVITPEGHVLKGNRPGIEHGTGDYVVYADSGSIQDSKNSWIVNGAIFDNLYEPY